MTRSGVKFILVPSALSIGPACTAQTEDNLATEARMNVAAAIPDEELNFCCRKVLPLLQLLKWPC
jgi:hypothetical protein